MLSSLQFTEEIKTKEEKKNYTLDIVILVLFIISLPSLYLIRRNATIPAVQNNSMTVFYLGLIGIVLYLAVMLSKGVFVIDFQLSSKPKNEKRLMRIIAWTVIGSILNAIMVVFISYLMEQKVFETQVSEVYAFFIFSAICEEMFWRLGLASAIMAAEEIYVRNMGKFTRLGFEIVNSVAIGAAFAFAHAQYRNNMYQFLDVFLLGIIYTFIFYRSHSLFPSLINHILNNFAAAGSVIQTLAIFFIGSEYSVLNIEYSILIMILGIIQIGIILLLTNRKVKKNVRNQTSKTASLSKNAPRN